MQTLPASFPLPAKETRQEDEDNNSDEEAEDDDAPEGSLTTLLESAAAFLEAMFSSKLDINSWKAKIKANGTPDLRWIQCAKLDPVVSANVPEAASTVNRASRIFC